MILVDANLLLYAYNSGSPQHDAACRWLEQVFSGSEPVRMAWTTLLAFLRIATNPRVQRTPLSMAEATEIVTDWLRQPRVGILEPGERHWDILKQILEAGQMSGPLVSDAHLAALAIEYGATLQSTDRDFTRVEGLRVLNPIA